MTTFRRWSRALLLCCTCAALTHGRVQAEDKNSDVPPEVTAKCTEFLKKVIAARRKHLDKHMADEIAEVVKVTGLGPDGVKALQAAAVTAEDASQVELLSKGVEFFARTYARNGGRGLEGLDRPEVVESVASTDTGFDLGIRYNRPLDQPAWTDALAQTLTPEQAESWRKAMDAKNGVLAKEFDDMMDRQSDQIRTTLSSPMFTRSTEIIDTLSLPKERADAVTDLAKKAIDASMDAWRKSARKMFLANDEAVRARLVRGMQFYSPPNQEDQPTNQPVWTQGIAKLLTDDDRAKLESSHGTQRKRRTHALAVLMVALMDEKVAFTASQRPRLEPIMERLVQTVEEFYPRADSNNDYFNLSVTSFYRASVAGKEEELSPILDELQWKHWQAASHDRGQPNEMEEEPQPLPTPAKTGTDAIEEPEDLEQFVSDYLAAKSASQHKELDAIMLLQAEDATRVAGLPEVTAARLRTAARGAAEMALANWVSSFEQSIRGQVQGATKETLLQQSQQHEPDLFRSAHPEGPDPLETSGQDRSDAGPAGRLAGRTRCPREVQRRSRRAVPARGVRPQFHPVRRTVGTSCTPGDDRPPRLPAGHRQDAFLQHAAVVPHELLHVFADPRHSRRRTAKRSSARTATTVGRRATATGTASSTGPT